MSSSSEIDASTPTDSSLLSTKQPGLSEGALIGILCGAVVVLVVVLVVLLVYLYVIPNQRRSKDEMAVDEDTRVYDNAAVADEVQVSDRLNSEDNGTSNIEHVGYSDMRHYCNLENHYSELTSRKGNSKDAEIASVLGNDPLFNGSNASEYMENSGYENAGPSDGQGVETPQTGNRGSSTKEHEGDSHMSYHGNHENPYTSLRSQTGSCGIVSAREHALIDEQIKTPEVSVQQSDC